MSVGRTIRVLVVDDSRLFREVIARGLATDPRIEVVAKAGDPFEARDLILLHRPDVMTCDIEMPRMNGIEFIRKLMPQYPLPTIAVSSLSGAVFEALQAGAVDFVHKADVSSVRGVEAFLEELIAKVKIAAVSRVSAPGPESVAFRPKSVAAGVQVDKLIAIGASTGGTEAIHTVLKGLPATVPGIVIVQHIPPRFSTMFAERLNQTTSFRVKEASSGDMVESGQVLVAPGDQHMRIVRMGGRFRVECEAGEKVNGHCPSIDVLFESAARALAGGMVGVLLTGMGYDGARGMLALRRKGARTIGQDEPSSVVYGMPKAAYELGAVERQASLADIPRLIVSMLDAVGHG